ncbi:hypothetical protein FOZ62_002914 [Perkinsus olseni]|uniref:Uncharacterized protein n=1 Tax=Perkinsus olseni TaxID=32597 RepID=A0A7J6S3V1_PEROL|nr:hypothetical protein FOZ62_002914 [Perkinsus olseni]
MLYLYDRAELRRVTSGILHYLDSKMRGMPGDCLLEVWAMAHPQIEGLERASRISLFADDGSAFSALQGSDDAYLKLLFSDNIDYCVHTPPAYIYIMYKGNSLNRILRSTSFVRDLHDELRPWSAGCLSDDAEYKWTRGRGGPGSKDSYIPFVQHYGVWLTSFTVGNDVGWLKTAWTPEATVWQVDLISENVLTVFEEPVEPYGIRAQPNGGLWATLVPDGQYSSSDRTRR